MKLTRSEHNPVLAPNPDLPWENLVTCNPGVWYEQGVFYMLYRAAGDDPEHVIRIGLATSRDGVHFMRASEAPVFGPSSEGPDSGAIEDPRIVKFGDEFYITYAFRPCPPGQYWRFAHDEVLRPAVDEFAPTFLRENLANTGLATTCDFKTFRRLGRITNSRLDDRDVILFPEKIGGKYVMMHRPKQYVGQRYGVKYPSIWLEFSDDLLDWEGCESHLLLTGVEHTWEEKVGGSTPPLRTDEGWLVLYHGVSDCGKGYYRVGALLLDLENPLKILGKTRECILEPETAYETEGFYKGCVFPTGNVIVNGILYVYYGAGDRYVCLATCPLRDLLDYIKNGR